jgi:hypothetical protein
MKTICKQLIVISIILLLVGVSISSAISVDTKSTISDKDREECRECNEVSDADLIRVERLLDRVEVYSKLLLVLSRHNPELREISEELSKDISKLTRMLEELTEESYLPIICTIVGINLILFAGQLFFIGSEMRSLEQQGLQDEFIYKYYVVLYKIVESIVNFIGYIYFIVFECPEFPYYEP